MAVFSGKSMCENKKHSAAPVVSRRRALMTIAAAPLLLGSLFGCEKTLYNRPSQKLRLSDPESLLFDVQPVAHQSVLVFRDEEGWATMDARCSYDGCDLSFNGEYLMCACCQSVYDISGQVIYEPANRDLAWFKMGFEHGVLVAFSGETVGPKQRFTTPDLEKQVMETRQRIRKDGPAAVVRVPTPLFRWDELDDGSLFGRFTDADLQRYYPDDPVF